MKVLVTGVAGQLGYDVMEVLKERQVRAIGADLAEFDITNLEATEKFIRKAAPDVIVHCSAYTAVDRAEDEVELCRRVNVEGTKNIAKVCAEIDAKLIYISTDYVFSGISEKAYEVDDQVDPVNVYGKMKLAGELAVQEHLKRYFIVRTSWVFGENGNNFIKTMLRLGKGHEEVRVVSDQIGSPTYTADLAILLCDMLSTEKYGIYHATNEGFCSWADFAEEAFRQAQMPVKVVRIESKAYPTKARRPMNSRLSKEKLVQSGFKRLPYWQDAVKRYMAKVSLISDI